MSTLILDFPVGTVPDSISLTALAGSPAASTSLPVAFTGPVTLGSGKNRWTATFAGTAVYYAYTAVATISGDDSQFSGTVLGDGATATGLIIDQASLLQYIGSINLAVLSQQDNAATSDNAAAILGAIQRAEAQVYSVLLQLRVKAGTFFAFPFTVGGVALKSSASIVALPLLQDVAHRYAVDQLNEWRVIQSASQADAEGSAVTARVKLEKSWADQQLRGIIRWAWGYTDGSYVDLDLGDGAVVGQIYKQIPAVVAAGATVDRNGLPEVPIINPAALPWYGPWPAPWISE